MITLPLYFTTIKAGFPSPADDFLDRSIDLNDHLIPHPAATFLVTVSGDSMIKAGIFPGDILIVDKSLEPKNRDIVIGVIDNEFTVKRFVKISGGDFLYPENPTYKPIRLSEGNAIWGVVTYVIHKC
jgi:DNA polymerase V